MDQNSTMGGYPPAEMPAVAPAGATPAPSTPITPAGMAPVQNMPAAVAVPPVAEKKNTVIETVILVVVCLIAAVAIVFAVLYFMRWNKLKTDYETDKKVAVAEAKQEQRKEDDALLEEKMNEKTAPFTGPEDLGSLSFNYPKAWSVYIQSDSSQNNDYSVYFAPDRVLNPDNKEARYALHFSIKYQSFNDVVKDYEQKIEDGDVTSSNFTAGDNLSGTRYEGKIDEDIDGIVVVVKVSDKTAIFQTDVRSEYEKEFDKLMQSLRRNS